MRNLTTKSLSLFNYLKSKHVMLPSLMFLTLFFLATSLWQSRRLFVLGTMQNGLNTCFWRVAQSYTAYMRQQFGSSYLRSEFLTSTEDCFSELNAMSSGIGAGQIYGKNSKAPASAQIRINSMTADVHWFHQKIKQGQEGRKPALAPVISSGSSTGALSSKSGPSRSFTKLERLFSKISEQLERARIANKNQILSNGLIGLCAVILFGLYGFFFVRQKNAQAQRKAEAEQLAAATLFKGQAADLEEVKSIMIHSLEAAQMPITSQLLNNYNWKAPVKDYTSYKRQEKEEVRETANHFEESSSREIPLWQPVTTIQDESRDESTILGAIQIQLEEQFSKALDLMAGRIFSLGVNINLELNELAKIKLDGPQSEEILDYVFFNALAMCLDRLSQNDEHRKLAITLQSENEKHSMQFVYNLEDGQALDQKALKTLQAIAGQIGIMAKEEKIDQSKAALILTFSQTPMHLSQGRLTKIQKGKKKDLINRLSGPTI